MKRAFAVAPEAAYRYAATDAVLTLLLAERMADLHRGIYQGLGFAPEEVPRCHATPGLRVSNLILRDLSRRERARTPPQTEAPPVAAAPTLSAVKQLFTGGSADSVSSRSRYGPQTGQTHGGLLFSRTPTTLFHAAPGAFRDLDLSSCYPSILRAMSVYAGRPVVWEPGNEPVTLREAVARLDREAAGWDGWFVRVTGPISAAPNALIPSTVDALTHGNYKSRAARRRWGGSQQRNRAGGAPSGRGYSRLFGAEVSSGVVVWPIWKMIQALPPELRREYENLRVESAVFYPRGFVADSWPGLAALRTALATGADLDWTQRLDLAARTLTTVDELDETYAALRYPVAGLADHLVRLRREARASHAGAGMDRALKLCANTLYGALCSAHLPTQNVVAAQVVTGTARALAFAMAQSLNSHNVITDGVIHRRDQIPAGTFASCLRARPDYPVVRAEGELPFLAPGAVPGDDEQFTRWYAGHAMKFFGVRGGDYQFLFGQHGLEHKRLPGSAGVAFDGLVCDGAANYAKLVTGDFEDWEVADFKARSYRADDRRRLADWLLAACSADRYAGPPPAVESIRLLPYADAIAACRRIVRGAGRVIVPLGMARPRVQSYRVIKPSQFVFQTARQRRRIEAEWAKFVEETACGLELLALRKQYGGSLSAVACAVHGLIRSGGDRLRPLNTHRVTRGALARGPEHAERVRVRREELDRQFLASLVAARAPAAALATGLSLDRLDLVRIAG